MVRDSFGHKLVVHQTRLATPIVKCKLALHIMALSLTSLTADASFKIVLKCLAQLVSSRWLSELISNLRQHDWLQAKDYLVLALFFWHRNIEEDFARVLDQHSGCSILSYFSVVLGHPQFVKVIRFNMEGHTNSIATLCLVRIYEL